MLGPNLGQLRFQHRHADRRANHSARSHPHSARSHPHSARSHPLSARSHPLSARSHPLSARSHPLHAISKLFLEVSRVSTFSICTVLYRSWYPYQISVFASRYVIKWGIPATLDRPESCCKVLIRLSTTTCFRIFDSDILNFFK